MTQALLWMVRASNLVQIGIGGWQVPREAVAVARERDGCGRGLYELRQFEPSICSLDHFMGRLGLHWPTRWRFREAFWQW